LLWKFNIIDINTKLMSPIFQMNFNTISNNNA
jgi:hypothetical protein